MRVFTFLSIRTQQLSLMREGKKKRPLVLNWKENGHAKQASLCWREESRGRASPMAAWVRPHRPLLIGTQTLPFSLSLSHRLKYFRQNTSNFLFLKLSCISDGIPSDPGE